MASTAIKIKHDGKDTSRLVIITEPHAEGTVVHWYSANTEWIPVGNPLQTAAKEPEEEYVTRLRKEAAEKKQLITAFCTDPEWNPENYKEDEV